MLDKFGPQFLPPGGEHENVYSSAFAYSRHLWNSLEGFFRSHGYELFVTGPGRYSCCQTPRDPEEIRAPDPWHRMINPVQKAYQIKYSVTVGATLSLRPRSLKSPQSC